jgi:hypothetical protein
MRPDARRHYSTSPMNRKRLFLRIVSHICDGQMEEIFTYNIISIVVRKALLPIIKSV